MGYDDDDCLLCFLLCGNDEDSECMSAVCLQCLERFAEDEEDHVSKRLREVLKGFVYVSNKECCVCGVKKRLMLLIPECGEHFEN